MQEWETGKEVMRKSGTEENMKTDYSKVAYEAILKIQALIAGKKVVPVKEIFAQVKALKKQYRIKSARLTAFPNTTPHAIMPEGALMLIVEFGSNKSRKWHAMCVSSGQYQRVTKEMKSLDGITFKKTF